LYPSTLKDVFGVTEDFGIVVDPVAFGNEVVLAASKFVVVLLPGEYELFVSNFPVTRSGSLPPPAEPLVALSETPLRNFDTPSLGGGGMFAWDCMSGITLIGFIFYSNVMDSSTTMVGVVFIIGACVLGTSICMGDGICTVSVSMLSKSLCLKNDFLYNHIANLAYNLVALNLSQIYPAIAR
jgi:hypothetical protein